MLTYVVILTLTNLNFSKLFQVGSLLKVSPLSSFLAVLNLFTLPGRIFETWQKTGLAHFRL